MENFVLWRHRARSVSRKIGGLAWARSSRTAPASADVVSLRRVSDASPPAHFSARLARRGAALTPRRGAPRLLLPCCLLVQLQGAQGCPCGVTAWDPCPSEGCVVGCALSAPCSMQSALELALGQGRPDQGGDAEGRLAPRATLAEGCATAWVLHNLNRTRTLNACVESGWHWC